MNATDILVVAIAIIAIIIGFRRGLITQLGSMLAIIVAIVCCRLFGDTVTVFFNGLATNNSDSQVSSPYLNNVIANILVFVVAYFLTKLLSGIIKKLVHGIHLGIADNFGGAVFNLFKWIIIASLAFNLWYAVFPDNKAIKSSSGIAGKWILDFAPKIFSSETTKNILDAAKELNIGNISTDSDIDYYG